MKFLSDLVLIIFMDKFAGNAKKSKPVLKVKLRGGGGGICKQNEKNKRLL